MKSNNLMSRNLLLISALLYFSTAAQASSVTITFLGKIILLPDSTEAAAIISQPDVYTHGLTPFDLLIRLGKEGGTENDYLSMAAKEVRNWNSTQQQEIRKGLSEMESDLNRMHLHFRLPDTVRIINSTTKNEFGAEGYTRGAFVVLNPDNPEGLGIHLLAHELFHVFSRYNHAQRDAIYASIGFVKCNPVDYSTVAGGKKISNPDCPVVEHYTTIPIKGAAADVALIIYCSKPYEPGMGLQDLVDIGLLKLEGKAGYKHPALNSDGSAVIYSLQDGVELFHKIGTNTPYILHPEEISAEHFVMMLTSEDVKEPKYPKAIQQVLAE